MRVFVRINECVLLVCCWVVCVLLFLCVWCVWFVIRSWSCFDCIVLFWIVFTCVLCWLVVVFRCVRVDGVRVLCACVACVLVFCFVWRLIVFVRV